MNKQIIISPSILSADFANLERDIKDLTGNGKRSVIADKKGWDAVFKAPEEGTDFGRGTLLIQHIDPNGKTRTVTYTDYLAANAENSLIFEYPKSERHVTEDGKEFFDS